ncbi:lysophospholipid acyltransferase family protein [Xanthomonas cerealis]|uniref:hypothetical protein n=1 Tax=Xanthomonas cerealis TaxID=3390025 RepID=UPI0021AF6618|nr:hypothetical protein [Xanthomonas translucens]
MLALERRLQDRYPYWFAGRRSRLVRPLLRCLQKWSGLDALEAFLDASHELHGFALVQAGMDFLQARYVVAPAPAECIPARGRLLIVANHPSGALDALALLDCVGQVRRDVKIVANDFLWALEGLRELLLPVRIHARNSALFKPAGTALLAREMFARRERRIAPSLGHARALPQGQSDAELMRGLRRGRRASR